MADPFASAGDAFAAFRAPPPPPPRTDRRATLSPGFPRSHQAPPPPPPRSAAPAFGARSAPPPRPASPQGSIAPPAAGPRCDRSASEGMWSQIDAFSSGGRGRPPARQAPPPPKRPSGADLFRGAGPVAAPPPDRAPANPFAPGAASSLPASWLHGSAPAQLGRAPPPPPNPYNDTRSRASSSVSTVETLLTSPFDGFERRSHSDPFNALDRLGEVDSPRPKSAETISPSAAAAASQWAASPADLDFVGMSVGAPAAPPPNPFGAPSTAPNPFGASNPFDATPSSSFPARKASCDSFGELGEDDSPEADARKRNKEKEHSLRELLSTEETYRDMLATFVERLQRPLAWCCASGAPPPDAPELRSCLPEAEDARCLHRALAPLPAEALLAISEELIVELRRRCAPFDADHTLVGGVFAHFADRLADAMCTWYDWHERADCEVRKLVEKPIATRVFVKRAADDKRCKDHQVSSLLIAPTQRLVRQLLFLQRLSKTTPAHHADSQPLKAAEATWIKTLEACNAVAGAHAMRRRAEAIESVLDGAPRNVLVTAPGRKLAHEGELTKIGGSTVRPDYFFLFETLSSTELLHTSAPDAQGHFAFKRFLRVLHVEDVELGSGAHEGGGIDRNRIYARRGSIGGRTATSSAAGGSAPTCEEEDGASLLLRVVASDPSDPKHGHVYSLGGERQALVEWKCKMTNALGKSSSEWRLRFKGDVQVLGEAFATYAAAEVKDPALRNCFMWFFSGRFGGMVVRATAGKNRSGKLEWHEAYRVQSVDGSRVPASALVNNARLRKRAAQGDVFRIVARDPQTNVEKTLVLASDDKDLIVELMAAKP